MNDSATLSVPQAAKVLGIGERTAYDLIARDEFPVRTIRVGTRLKVSRKALDAFIGGEPEQPAAGDTAPPVSPAMELAVRIMALGPQKLALVEAYVAGLEAAA